MVGYTKSEKEEMCSTTFRINGLFEYIDSDFEYFLTEKIKFKTTFEETELLHLLESMVDALVFLQKHNISHGDVKPGTILVTKNDEYKL